MIRNYLKIALRHILNHRLFSAINIIGLTFGIPKQYVRILIIAFLIAIPICYFLMQDWLDNFVYHISPVWWLFPVAFAVVTLISLLTMSGQTIRAALSNPTDSRGYE